MVGRARIYFFVLVAAIAACDNNFEKVSIVLDLRALAARSDPAEVVVDVDPANLESIVPPDVRAIALLADPLGPRPVAYHYTACPVTDTFRCDEPAAPNRVFADAVTTNVDADPPAGVLRADAELLRAALDADDFHGLGGIPVQIELAVRPADATPETTVYTSKLINYAARMPADRTANQNPTIAALQADGADWPEDQTLALRPGQEVVIFPVEGAGSRETYSLPTLDGDQRQFTENLRYSWYADGGDFSDEKTGGPVDIFGNVPLLRTRFAAPGAPATLRLWVVQRDERGGTSYTGRRIIVGN